MLGVIPCSLELNRTETEFIFMFCAFYQQFIYKYNVSRRKMEIHKSDWPALWKGWFKWVYNTDTCLMRSQYCTKIQIQSVGK